MIDPIQYLVTLRIKKEFHLKNGSENYIAQSTPFLYIIDFIRTSSSEYENVNLPKLENLIKNLTPVELSSNRFVFKKESIVSTVDSSYPMILAGKIGEIFDVRKYDDLYCEVSLKNKHVKQEYYEDLNNLFIEETSSFIWKSYSICIYRRPYCTNKYWTQAEYRLLKEYILKGETKKSDLINKKFATQLKLTKPNAGF
jgi:hypothetical protein